MESIACIFLFFFRTARCEIMKKILVFEEVKKVSMIQFSLKTNISGRFDLRSVQNCESTFSLLISFGFFAIHKQMLKLMS